MIDHLRQMAIFAKTMDHRSFRGAARELRLSPSVVSHHVAQLEERLGVALMYRSTRKLSLTPEGARLLEVTRGMLEVVEGALTDLSLEAAQPSGVLRVTLPSVLSQAPVMAQIARFARDHPKVMLELDFSDTRKGLIEEGFDLAIRMGGRIGASATSRPLGRIRRVLVAAPEYLEGRKMPNRPQDLQDWEWLVLTPAQKVPVVLRAQGDEVVLKLEGRAYASDAQALYRLAREGVGFAAVPEFLAEADIAAGRVQQLLPEWELNGTEVTAVWPANAPKHGLVHLLLGALGTV